MRGRPQVLVTSLAASLFAVAHARAEEPPSAEVSVDKQACLASYESSQKLRKDGKLVDAARELRACARTECPAIVQGDCAAWLREVEAAMPTVIFAARDPNGDDVTDVTVSIDGVVVLSALDGKSIAIDPGAHQVRFDRGGRHLEQKLVVFEGEKARVVRVTLGAPPEAPPPPVHEEPSAPGRTVPAASWVLGSVSLVSAGAFAYFAIRGSRELAHLRATCAPQCDPDDVDATRTRILVGDVALSMSIVSLGAAAAIWFLQPSASPTTPRVGIAVTPSTGFLSVAAAF